jgi:DNA-binding MarR family transcriptional regulator
MKTSKATPATKPQALTPEQKIASECLAGRLRMLARVVTSVYDNALRPLGVRISQAAILVMIAAFGPLRAVDVCRRLRLEKSTLSRDLERLMARKWVKATAVKGRVQMLEITPVGRELLQRGLPAWEEAQKKAREILTPALADGILDVVAQMNAGAASDAD